MYAQALLKSDPAAQEGLHLLFGTVESLVGFQRGFLVQMERTAALARHVQQWGRVFLLLVSFDFISFAERLTFPCYVSLLTGRRIEPL
jgi:hypothetical protein